MNKQDLSKTYKTYYTASRKPAVADFTTARYISITGKGDPSGEAFSADVQVLYPVAYQIKFDSKTQGRDFVVAKLEGLWWYDEQRYTGVTASGAPVEVPRSEWEYRLLIRMPEEVSASDVEAAVARVVSKKGIKAAEKVSYFEMNEGKCVQMMHIGPFDKEPESLALIQEFMNSHQMKRNGLHHEIYLSDFRKTPPEKLKTILREPFK